MKHRQHVQTLLRIFTFDFLLYLSHKLLLHCSYCKDTNVDRLQTVPELNIKSHMVQDC